MAARPSRPVRLLSVENSVITWTCGRSGAPAPPRHLLPVGLTCAHRGVSRCYYLETVLRHATKPDAECLKHVTADHLRDWYREKDLLPDGLETIIDAASTLDDTIQQILS